MELYFILKQLDQRAYLGVFKNYNRVSISSEDCVVKLVVIAALLWAISVFRRSLWKPDGSLRKNKIEGKRGLGQDEAQNNNNIPPGKLYLHCKLKKKKKRLMTSILALTCNKLRIVTPVLTRKS